MRAPMKIPLSGGTKLVMSCSWEKEAPADARRAPFASAFVVVLRRLRVLFPVIRTFIVAARFPVGVVVRVELVCVVVFVCLRHLCLQTRRCGAERSVRDVCRNLSPS